MSADTLGKYCEACQAFPIIGYCRLAGCPNVPASGEKTLIERLREHVRIFRQAAGFIESGSSVAILFDEAADALSDRDARIAELEGGFRIIAEGTVSSGQNGHYLAHRYAVKIARALLTPTGTEIKDE